MLSVRNRWPLEMATVNRSIAEPAGSRIELEAACKLSAAAEVVWALIGNFGAPQSWLPGIHHVEMHGCSCERIRICQTVLGLFREQLAASGPLWCSYVIVDGPLPVLNYKAVLAVQNDASPNSCQVLWKSTFDPKPPTASGVARGQIAQLYDIGLRALQAKFGSIEPDPLFRAGASGDLPLQTFLTN
jgi:hypothetical protein